MAKVSEKDRSPPEVNEASCCLMDMNMEAKMAILREDIGDLLVHEKGKNEPWPTWREGIINLNRTRKRIPVKEGNIWRQAVKDCVQILSKATCEYKAGIATSVSKRWAYYKTAESNWTPTHLFVLTGVEGRSGAAYFESGIIAVLECLYKYDELSINLRGKDYGGGGAKWESTEDAIHFVYFAVKTVDM